MAVTGTSINVGLVRASVGEAHLNLVSRDFNPPD